MVPKDPSLNRVNAAVECMGCLVGETKRFVSASTLHELKLDGKIR